MSDSSKTKLKEAILEKIKSYDRIIIARHIRPDGDAIGSAHGLARIIKLSFPEKEVIVSDQDSSDFLAFLETEEEDPDSVDYKGALAIVVDTGNVERISNKHIQETRELIKIDHHIDNAPYGDISWVEEERSSTSEMITEFLYTFKDTLKYDKKVALLLYTGIITDCGNFKYECTSGDTLRYAAFLLDEGIDISTLHAHLELESFSYFKFQAHVYEKMQITENGVAYIYVDKEMQERFNLSKTQQSNSVDMMQNIRGSLIWIAFIDNPEGDIRVRLRSRFVPINTLAEKYSGGGHANAAGATVHSVQELKALVKEADEILKDYKSKNGGWI
ncbi:MAG: bifunctional oligoribonuclease/PAP phosphatase NrnA [Spirochaetales bacterium]|nr:bifunctional oligoribonuclease/PAP phosphatase NrnA [Spirochaetales bacterium]MBO6049427.1 bifunctional oligoribonuclease/PAP phosphatase NrnA [Spirochaetales bacterium]MBO7348877.1 bifunctional oligoribonuclease/PAP phosphatase NrnA [Spirochaetales bacterium]